MTGTFRKIDYRLRPAKHAERSMLIEIVRKLQHSWKQETYVGFGAISFVDFRLFFRALNLKALVSIEDVKEEADQERFRKNKPLDIIDLRFGHSNVILPQLDLSAPSVLWLDYDDLPNAGMLSDLRTIARKAASGTFVAVTFTDDFPTEKKPRERRLEQLKVDFPSSVPDDAKWTDFVGERFSNFIRRSFGAFLDKALSDADAKEGGDDDPRRAHQICYFRYRDGAPMATVAWVIVRDSERQKFADCRFEELPFCRMAEEPFTLRVPLLTTRESHILEQKMPDLKADDPSLEWIPNEEIASFISSYKYLPLFAPVELL